MHQAIEKVRPARQSAQEITAALTAKGVAASLQSKNVVRVQLGRESAMFYPTSNQWQYRGKVHRGGLAAFQEWAITKTLEARNAEE